MSILTILQRAPYRWLWLTAERHTVDGVSVRVQVLGNAAYKQATAARVTEALSLLARLDPNSLARVRRLIPRILVTPERLGLGRYERSLQLCFLQDAFVMDPATTLVEVAAVIVHEATHARLDGLPFRNRPSLLQAERLCSRIELECARRLAAASGVVFQSSIGVPPEPAELEPDAIRQALVDGSERTLRAIGLPAWALRLRAWLARRRAA